MVAGAQGQVGRHVTELFEANGYEVLACDRRALDITSKETVIEKVLEFRPDILINAAAYTAVDKAEDEEELAYQVNCLGAKYLAIAAQKVNARFFHLSTDYVFDGKKSEPYVETDNPNPNSAYGRTKLAGEQAVLSANPDAVVLRVSWVFSQYGNNFVKTILRLAKERDELKVVDDQYGGPTWAGHIAQVLLELTKKTDSKKIQGVYHFSDKPYCSWFDFAEYFLEKFSCSNIKVRPIESMEFTSKVQRPINSRLSSDKINDTLYCCKFSWSDAIDSIAENRALLLEE